MKITIVDPKKVILDGEINYCLASGNCGELVIMENHIPIIVPIKNGFIKTVIDDEQFFYKVSGGILEQNNNKITVIAQEVASGNTLEKAIENLEKQRQEQIKKNKKQAVDFSEMERDLALSIKEAKASQL